MGITSRAIRNISRRKIRALLVIIALGFSMAILVSIPAGVLANQEAASSLAENLSGTINVSDQTINQTLTQIDCSLSSGFSGFGFSAPNVTITDPGEPFGPGGGGATPSTSVFDPNQFGGGTAPGQFGGGSFSGGQVSPMNQTLYTDLEDISGVDAVAYILQATEGENVTTELMGRNFTQIVPDYVIEGVSLTSEAIDHYTELSSNITAGRSLLAGETGVVVLSENNSVYFNAGVGDEISILDYNFTVVGIHGTTSNEDLQLLYMSLEDAQTITNNTGYITSISVFAQDSSMVTNIANEISSLHSELTVTTAQQRMSQLTAMQEMYTTALESAEASISQTQTVAFEEILVVVAATSLIVLFVMLYTVKERTKEIGTLKAIGFSNYTVMGQFMLEGIMLSAIAGVVGVVIGVFAAPVLSSLLLPSINTIAANAGRSFMANAAVSTTSVTVEVSLVLLAFGAALLLGTLGSLYPAWRAARIRPAEAMRYE
ncbi:MAG: FtsX-like permease family protein [Candidatus Bathyarchaeota archaeon]|nr:FtsX-like permease family protein [Candidatus Bathyarchaeota archaeon]